MSCFIKLREGAYIQWSKDKHRPKSCILSKEQLEEIFLHTAKARKLLGHKEDYTQAWQRLDNYGTTDQSLQVTIESILEKNHAGPEDQHLSLEDFFLHFNS